MGRKGLFRACVLSGLCLLLLGCAHVPLASDYNGPKKLPEEIKKAFAYKKFTGDYTEKILEQKANYTVRQIEFTPNHNILPIEHKITIDYYDINGNKSVPVIMVLPVLGGSNSVSESFATYFAEHGYSAIIVHRQKQYSYLKNIDDIDKILRQIVFDHKQAIDWIETQKDLDSSRIGVFGVSMGGIKCALLSSLDDRVKASVVALAAGDIPYVLTYSSEKGIVKRRNKLLQGEKLTIDNLYQRLDKIISCDPLNYAEYINANNVLMILAKFDSVVPYHKGEELKQKIGNPETIYLIAGHYTSILYISYIEYESMRFFEKKFKSTLHAGGDKAETSH